MTSGYTLRQCWYSQHPEHSGLWPRKGWQCLYPSFIHTGPAWWVAHSRGSGNSPSELTRTHTHTRPSTQESPFIYLPSGRLLCITSEFPPFSKSWFLCGMQAFRSCTSEFPKDMYAPLATRGRRRGSVRGHTSPPHTHVHCFGSTEACQMLDTVVPDPHGSSLFPGVALGRLPQFPHLCFIELMLGGK